jgi:membrane protein
MPADLKGFYGRFWKQTAEQTGIVGAFRTLALAVTGFIDDRCMLRASTLTFYSLLSIVPLLAVAFGIAKGFGLRPLFDLALSSPVEWQREFTAFVVRFSSAALVQARGGIIAGVGVLALFISVVGLLGAIEESFNTIWKVRSARSLGRQFVDYLSVVFIGTVLLSVSAGASVFVTAQVRFVAQKVTFLVPASRVVLDVLQVVPFVVNWLLFSLLFLFMPNAKVPLGAGTTAGALAAALFQLVQWAYILFQVGVSNYGAVYGSFAALPLFLVWLQTSWTIALFGGELAYAIANNRTYGFSPGFGAASVYLKKVLASALCAEIARCFEAGERAPGAGELSARLRIPPPFTCALLDGLAEARLVSEVTDPSSGARGYQPGVPVERLSLAAVLRSIEYKGETAVAPGASGTVRQAQAAVDAAEAAIHEKSQKKAAAGDI